MIASECMAQVGAGFDFLVGHNLLYKKCVAVPTGFGFVPFG